MNPGVRLGAVTGEGAAGLGREPSLHLHVISNGRSVNLPVGTTVNFDSFGSRYRDYRNQTEDALKAGATGEWGMGRKQLLWAVALLVSGSAGLFRPGAAAAQGLILPGSGAVHLSMAGASTAVGADALGALYWNPAAISGLPGSEVVIGGEALIGDTRLSGIIPAGAFGPLGPAATISGETRSDSGVGLVSGVGFVYRREDSPLSYGVGTLILAGGSVNFPGNNGTTTPNLAPVGPFNNFVLGPQAASSTIVGVVPTVSYQLTEQLAFGFAPVLGVSVVNFDPALFGPADDANGDGLMTFPTGSHSRPFYGGGFRAGFTYRAGEHLVAGVSYASPVWFETWRFDARTEVGQPFRFETQFTLPAIVSAGVAYTGIEGLLLATDVRYFDYRSTQLLGEPITQFQGGAGWDSIFAVAVGGRYQMSERMSVQLGYLYNENPVPENLALFNTQLPALIKHTLSAGVYMQMNESLGMSLAYVHGFKNSITGAIFPLRGVNTTLSTEYDSVAFGMHIKFGPAPRREACTACVTGEPYPAAAAEAPAVTTTTRTP